MATDNKASLANDPLPFAPADIRECNGELRIVKTLTEQWVNAVRFLLAGQSNQDVAAFEAALSKMQQRGYASTSLVAELRSSPQEGSCRKWTCEVRPKIGAVPGRIGESKMVLGTPQETKKKLGKRIRELRQAKGLTAAQLALASAVPYRHLLGMEKGKSEMRFNELMAIAKSLETTMTQLLDGIG